MPDASCRPLDWLVIGVSFWIDKIEKFVRSSLGSDLGLIWLHEMDLVVKVAVWCWVTNVMIPGYRELASMHATHCCVVRISCALIPSNNGADYR